MGIFDFIFKPKKQELSEDEQMKIFESFTPYMKRLLGYTNEDYLKIAETYLEKYHERFEKEIKEYENAHEVHTKNILYPTYYDSSKLFYKIRNDLENLNRWEKELKNFKSVTCGINLNKELYVYDINIIYTLPTILEALLSIHEDLIHRLKGQHVQYDKLSYDGKNISNFIIQYFKKHLYHENRHADQKHWMRKKYGYQFVMYVDIIENKTMEYSNRPSEIDAFNYGDKQMNQYTSNQITNSYSFDNLYDPFLSGFYNKDSFYRNNFIIRTYDEVDALIKNADPTQFDLESRHRFANYLLREYKTKYPDIFIGGHANIDLSNDKMIY